MFVLKNIYILKFYSNPKTSRFNYFHFLVIAYGVLGIGTSYLTSQIGVHVLQVSILLNYLISVNSLLFIKFLKLFLQIRLCTLCCLKNKLHFKQYVRILFFLQSLQHFYFQASLSFTGATTGPFLGMYLLGAFFPFGNKYVCMTIISTSLNVMSSIHKFHK